MYQYFRFLLLLSSNLVTIGSPFQSSEAETATNQDENNALHREPSIHRLKDHVMPLSYDLRMMPDLEKSIFSGTVVIKVLVELSTDRIELHSKNLKITDCKLANAYQQIEITFTLDAVNDLLIIERLQKVKFPYATEYSLSINFEGILEDGVTGFYKSSYRVDGNEKWLATTQFEPTYAREAFPCFDEPRFKVPFTIHLARFRSQKAISNMATVSVSSPDSSIGNRVWENFQQSPPIATYLVAFMVSEYEFKTDDEKKISVWGRGNALPHASYALKQATKLLKELQDYTSISYRLPKLDIVTVPDLSFGAMENWGMTTYKEKYIIMDEPASSELQRTIITLIISHEFSHQWFGDLVTPAWWDFTWLNEGFATYFEYFNAAEVEPSWKLDQLFIVEVVQAALWEEVVKQRAMTTTISTIDEIKNTFDIISYEKAGSVIRMMEHILSPETFRFALHNYLKNSHEKRRITVVQKDLFEEFDHQARRDSTSIPQGVLVSDIMKTWTENVGFPLITVIRNYTTGRIEIIQSTYKSPRAPSPTTDQEWIVPITYTTKSERKFSDTKPTLWSFGNKMTHLNKEIPTADWIIFNLQHSGYYRVNYDKNNWYLVLEQLHQKPEEIHVLNRAQLIDDSFALAYDNIICYHVPLQLLPYLSKETDMIPWYSAIEALNRFYSKYEESLAQDLIRNYVIKVIREPYNTFGFHIKLTDDHVTKMVKPLFLDFACKIKLAECIVNSLEEYKKNQEDLTKVQPDLKEVVFCNALSHSDNQHIVFDNLWKLYLSLDSTYDKSLVLTSLSCATDHEIIKKILSKLVDSKNNEIRKPDRTVIFRTFFSRIPSVTGSLVFLQDKISTISELDEFGVTTLKNILEEIENNVNTKIQIELLKNLIEKFIKMDQQKFGSFTSITQNAYVNGLKTIEDRETKTAGILSILQELLRPMSRSTAPQPRPIEEPKEPSSGAASPVSWLWSHLAVVSLVLYFGSKAF